MGRVEADRTWLEFRGSGYFCNLLVVHAAGGVRRLLTS